jgi:biopolymer transport protein ExbD
VLVHKALELQLAGRLDNYSDFGDTFNPKAGFRRQPRDNLLVHLSGGTGFKAPALHELYSGAIRSFASVVDPRTGKVREVESIASGNPDLDAEESENYSLGLVWDITPAWDVSVDLWRIHNENAVTSDPQFYVDNEARFPDNVVRQNGNIVRVLSPFQNVAAQKVQGLDPDTSVRWGSPRTGDFRFNLGAAYLGSFEEEPVPGAGFEELAGKDGRPRWRAKGGLLWSKASFETSLTVNYTGGYDRQVTATQIDGIGAWTTVDAQFNWRPFAKTEAAAIPAPWRLAFPWPPSRPWPAWWWLSRGCSSVPICGTGPPWKLKKSEIQLPSPGDHSMRKRRSEHLAEDAEINMTPMLDIVFIMLIFFVVTASFLKESGVEVRWPAASTAVRKDHGNILIGITRTDEIWIDQHQVDLRALRASVERLRAENPEGAVVIQADQDARTGLLVQVIDQARLAGAADVSIAAKVMHD